MLMYSIHKFYLLGLLAVSGASVRRRAFINDSFHCPDIGRNNDSFHCPEIGRNNKNIL